MTEKCFASHGESQTDIDRRNAAFWNELCGTALAKELGVTDRGRASLEKFDGWYMEYYAYLHRHIPFRELKGSIVLEVGLGYGTIAQKIAEAGALYSGLDIAAGPVEMVNHRLQQSGLPGKAVQGSVLEAPFPDASFDHMIAIGCFHHTGNLQRALDEAWRVLKPGGKAMVMVYYAYSYRRWRNHPLITLQHLYRDKVGQKFGYAGSTERERASYDASTEGGGSAPETAFASRTDLERMTVKWSERSYFVENIGDDSIFRNWSRQSACRIAGPWVGLDIYCHLVK